MVDLDKMPFVYWSDLAKVSFLQRRIIIYSIMYYDMNESCISDREYDRLSYMLVDLQKRMQKAQFEKSMYYYAMYDFDGSTGFDIPSRLNKHDKEYLRKMATDIYYKWKASNIRKEK